jgi:hypothetical protein
MGSESEHSGKQLDGLDVDMCSHASLDNAELAYFSCSVTRDKTQPFLGLDPVFERDAAEGGFGDFEERWGLTYCLWKPSLSKKRVSASKLKGSEEARLACVSKARETFEIGVA